MTPPSDEEPYDEVAVDTSTGRRLFRARVTSRDDSTAIWKPLAAVLSLNAAILIGCLAWGNNKLWDLQQQISDQNSVRVREVATLQLQLATQTGELNTQMARMTGELANLTRQIRDREQ